MIHHIQDRWLINLETKLHIATLKSDKLKTRLKKILDGVDECHKTLKEPEPDTSVKTKHRFFNKIRNKLAIKSKE